MGTDRRKFLRNLAFSSGALAVGVPGWALSDEQKEETLQRTYRWAGRGSAST